MLRSQVCTTMPGYPCHKSLPSRKIESFMGNSLNLWAMLLPTYTHYTMHICMSIPRMSHLSSPWTTLAIFCSWQPGCASRTMCLLSCQLKLGKSLFAYSHGPFDRVQLVLGPSWHKAKRNPGVQIIHVYSHLASCHGHTMLTKSAH